MSKIVNETPVVIETPEKTRFVLSPKHKKIVKIAAAVTGTAALIAVGYKLKEKDVVETTLEAVSAAAEVVTDQTA